MSRKRYTPEQIIGKLREAEAAFAQGETAAQGGNYWRRSLERILLHHAPKYYLSASSAIPCPTITGWRWPGGYQAGPPGRICSQNIP